MYRPKHLSFWARVLLAAGFCWSGGSAFSQSPKPNANANQKAKDNPVINVRQAARDELAAEVAARIQVDPQFKAYVDAVKAHEDSVKEFVKAKKAQGGAK